MEEYGQEELIEGLELDHDPEYLLPDYLLLEREELETEQKKLFEGYSGEIVERPGGSKSLDTVQRELFEYGDRSF